MEKMDGKTMNIVAENIAKLGELFPEAFVEDGTTDEHGLTQINKKIDFEILKELLGEYVSDKDERYSFTWNGKSKARMIAQTPSTGTLRPCKEESVDWDSTQNIFIEGDNLEVLKLLQKSYHKKVKMIYIDPPYNTGKDFVYKDNFKDNIKNYKEITGQVDGEGRNLSSNPETSGRYHTDWLNMMYPRLKLARNLLKDDGVIFISIDDNEVSNLRKMCDEVFGEENFVANIVWQKKYGPANDSTTISPTHDHILAFSKSLQNWRMGLLPRDEKQMTAFKNPDSDPRGLWRASDLSARTYSATCDYVIVGPDGDEFHPPASRSWIVSKERYEELLSDNRITFGTSGNGRPMQKKFLSEVRSGITPETWWTRDFSDDNKNARYEMKALIDENVFDTPKPSKLVYRFLQVANTSNHDLILDFFSGSSTTAHAVMQLNAEDNGNRKFIMVQLPEPCDEKSEAYKAGYKTIAEISKERIRRAAARIKEELTTKDTKSTKKEEGDLFAKGDQKNFRDFRAFRGSNLPDFGFKVFKLDSTNIKPWEVDFDMTERTLEDFISNIKTDRRKEDILYEILLKYGLDLTLPITEHAIAGQKVFDIGMGALIICLSDAISLEVVEGIARLKDELNPEIMRVVFKDSGFEDDVVKTNAAAILKQAGIVDVKSL